MFLTVVRYSHHTFEATKTKVHTTTHSTHTHILGLSYLYTHTGVQPSIHPLTDGAQEKKEKAGNNPNTLRVISEYPDSNFLLTFWSQSQ